jgi:hypothetical protein
MTLNVSLFDLSSAYQKTRLAYLGREAGCFPLICQMLTSDYYNREQAHELPAMSPFNGFIFM